MRLMNWSPLALTYSHIKGFMAQEEGGERGRAISTRDEVKLHHVWRKGGGCLKGWVYLSVRLCVCVNLRLSAAAHGLHMHVCALTSVGPWVCAGFCMKSLFVQLRA